MWFNQSPSYLSGCKMSACGIDALLDRLIQDGRLRVEFEADPDRVMKRFTLTDEQRDAMRSYDIGNLVAATAALSRPCPPAAIV